jgi:hypothetical protein
MQGQYPGNRGIRPPVRCAGGSGEAASAGRFLCTGCRTQLVVCSGCDRGQVLFAGDYARRARPTMLRRAGRRYQNAPNGSWRHAARQQRYRVLRKKSDASRFTPATAR